MRSPRQSMIPAPAAAPPPSRGQALDHPVLQCAKRAFDASLRLRAVGADDVDVQRQQGATELGYPVAGRQPPCGSPAERRLHRSSSHRCSPRRSAPSPSPTLPHRISRSRGVKSRPTCPSCGRPQHPGPLPIARSTPKPLGQVRNRVTAGGRWIRTLGPRSAVSSVHPGRARRDHAPS
jgi:hypothetical protein